MKLQKNILIGIVILFWFSQYVYMPYQTPYLLSKGAGASFVGVIVGVYGLSQMLLRMPVGIMADIRGRHKSFILIGAGASGFASILRVVLPGPVGFLLGNFLSGLASAMWISFMVLYSNYFDKSHMQKSMAVIIAANNLGILLGFVAGLFFYDGFGMDFLCVLSIVASVLSTIMAIFIKEPKPDFIPLPIKELTSVYRDKRLIGFSVVAMIQQGIVMSTAMSFTNEIAKGLGARGYQIGIISIIYIGFAVASSYFSASKMAEKLGAGFFLPWILICVSIYCIIVPNAESLTTIYFSQVLIAMSQGILFSFCTSEAMKNVPQTKKSTAMGYYQAIYAVGMTLIPIFSGMLSQNFGMRTAYYFMGIIAILGFCGCLYFYKFKETF